MATLLVMAGRMVDGIINAVQTARGHCNQIWAAWTRRGTNAQDEGAMMETRAFHL